MDLVSGIILFFHMHYFDALHSFQGQQSEGE